MPSKTKPIRFFTWVFIALFVVVGAGIYFWSEEKYETRAGTTANAPEASNTRASTGLASHWTFDREHISGTSITDRVGTNTGTSSGSPTAAIGKFGQALDFDASDDHVNVTSVASLDIDSTEDFSVAGWFNRDTFASDHTLVAKRNGQADTDDGYSVYIDDATDQLIFALSDTADTDTYSVASTATFTASGWHHFVAVWDQDSAAGTEVYIDGVASGTDTGTIANIGDLTEAVAFRIGSESDGGARFDGRLDDIRFYSSALSVADIYQLYTAGTATVNAPLDDPLSQGLRGYWKMDEGTGTSTTADASGNANTLTMTSMEVGDWVAGNIGPYSLDFDGSAEYLTVTDPASGVLDVVEGTSFTLTGWFNRDTFANDHTIIAKKTVQDTNTADGYIVWVDGTDDLLHVRADENGSTDAYSITSTSAFTSTGWNHFAVSWNDSATTNPVNVYINGALDGDADQGSGTFAAVGTLANSEAFRIGAESGTADNFFDGKIDDVRVYGFPLSADEVQKLYQTTAPTQPVDTGLVGYWTFDGPDVKGLTVIDRSGKGNDGTITGAVPALGKLGQGLFFHGDSAEDKVTIPHSISIDPDDLTVAVWVKRNGVQSAYSEILVKGSYISNDTSSPIWSYALEWEAGGVDIKWAINDNTASENALSATVPNDIWTHLVGTYTNGTKTSILYMDGVQKGSSLALSGTRTKKDDPLTLGHYLSQYSGQLAGSLDDVRVYNRVLSASEIVNLYNLGK